MSFSPFAAGSSLIFLALSVSPVLANSAREAAIEACRLHPACSVSELTVTCKGDTQCMVDRTTNRAHKGAKAANKASKEVKNLFKKKHKHHKH
tara:strand:- start:6 stop:284 length:279 start_codon:yes stop_codon:yes gene_type:complete